MLMVVIMMFAWLRRFSVQKVQKVSTPKFSSIPSFVLSLDFSRAPFAALRNTAPAGRPRNVLSVVGVGGAKVSTMRCKVSLSWRNSEGLEFK